MLLTRIKYLLAFLTVVASAFGSYATVRYQAQASYRPERVSAEFSLFEGVTYNRIIRDEPRKVVIHLVSIDLTANGIDFAVTKPDRVAGQDQMNARLTTDFVQSSGVQLAINGSFFYPFYSHNPWIYYPHEGDPVTLLGYNISDGVSYSAEDEIWYTGLCIKGLTFTLGEEGCPSGTEDAVSGQWIYVQDGKATVPPTEDKLPQPRTTVAYDKEQQRMWLIVVDGRQPGYSTGLTTLEMTEFSLELGAHTSLKLDGGGSSTLVVDRGSGPEILNSPIHNRVPMRERPVANHLGLRALPISYASD